MKSKSCSIDLATVTRKFYCHKCGDRLLRHARTRIVKRGDPDYKKHSRIGRMHTFGDVELTEYDFKCWTCDRVTGCDEQYVIERMQKKLGKHILSETEIAENEESARAAIARKKKLGNIIASVIAIAATSAALYFCLKSGDFSFKIYF